MRGLLFGVVLGTLLALGFAVGQGFSEPTVAGQSPAVSAVASSPLKPFQPAQPIGQSPGNLMTHVLPADGGSQALVVVDPVESVVAVYHVDRASGEIALRSVRNITWDLQMVEFNSGEPSPQDIRNVRGELQR